MIFNTIFIRNLIKSNLFCNHLCYVSLAFYYLSLIGLKTIENKLSFTAIYGYIFSVYIMFMFFMLHLQCCQILLFLYMYKRNVLKRKCIQIMKNSLLYGGPFYFQTQCCQTFFIIIIYLCFYFCFYLEYTLIHL